MHGNSNIKSINCYWT